MGQSLYIGGLPDSFPLNRFTQKSVPPFLVSLWWCLCVPLCVYVCVRVCVCMYASVCVSLTLFVCLCLSLCLSLSLSICLSVSFSLSLSYSPPLPLCLPLFVCLSLSVSMCRSALVSFISIWCCFKKKWKKLYWSSSVFLFFFSFFLFRKVVHLLLQMNYIIWQFSISLTLAELHSIFKGWPGVLCIFVCSNSGMAAGAWHFYPAHRCQCLIYAHRGCSNTVRVCIKSWLWENNPFTRDSNLGHWPPPELDPPSTPTRTLGPPTAGPTHPGPTHPGPPTLTLGPCTLDPPTPGPTHPGPTHTWAYPPLGPPTLTLGPCTLDPPTPGPTHPGPTHTWAYPPWAHPHLGLPTPGPTHPHPWPMHPGPTHTWAHPLGPPTLTLGPCTLDPPTPGSMHPHPPHPTLPPLNSDDLLWVWWGVSCWGVHCVVLSPCWKCGSPYLGKTAAAARTALPTVYGRNQCVQNSCVSEQWYGSQWSGFNMSRNEAGWSVA